MLLNPFVQSIAYINDSGTFESSFEVKHIQITPIRQKKYCLLNECERENLRRFVKEFEHLQGCNSSAKSTPKKFRKLNKNSSNIGNTSSRSLCQTPQWSLESLEENTDSNFPPSPPFSSTSFSPTAHDLDMVFKPLPNCDEDEDDNESSHGDSLQLCESAENSSYDMHPPLLPLFNVTPPKQQRNAAYELARFLRGSFHVKRAKITHLRRSLSDNENLQNVDLPPAQVRHNMSAKKEAFTEKTKKKVLDDTTNRTRCSTSSICTRLFPGNTSPFRRVWEQSSLRTSRSDKNALNVKQKTAGIRCFDSMIASESNVFAKTTTTTTASKSCSYNKLASPSAKMPMRTQSEKLTNSLTDDHSVKSWANSFEHLLQEPAALATFAEFLKLEFSAENIYFWTSCERYRNTDSLADRQIQAKQIYQKYLADGCREPVNLDSQTRNLSEEVLNNAEKNIFVTAQKQIFHLMKFDSYQRFIRSDLYKNCLQAEEKDQPLPYGADNLDAQLKTNFLQSASPKLKKSASNAEDRRRKIVLPWHRKTRSKSRDRIDLLNEENSITKESSDGCSNGLNTLLVPSSKLALLSSTLPPQLKPTKEYSDTQIQSLRSSLPTSLKAGETGCSLCRVKFCDGATTIVQIKPNETIQQLVERVLEKRGLHYKLYDVVIKGHSKAIDLHASTQEIAGEEVEIEQRITFKLYLPDPKVISVKSKPKKFLYEVITPILNKYNYDLNNVDILRRDNQEKIDLNQLVTAADGFRLQVIMHKNNSDNSQTNNNNMLLNYQNDNISMKWLKSKELANEIVARNNMESSLRNNMPGSQNNLDTITNNIFSDIIQDKAKPVSSLQAADQYSIKSEEYGSEVSSIFGTLNSKKDAPIVMRLKTKPNQHFTDATKLSNSSQTLNEFKKPIIAKLKAGVKLQVTERVAEKQDELLMSLKTRLDSQANINAESKSNCNDNEQITPLSLRLVRAKLSPVNKTNPCDEFNKILDKPKPLVRHSLKNKIQEPTNLTESEDTNNAANKGPPPLPPKPKVLPTKPSNWGYNISDQTTIQ